MSSNEGVSGPVKRPTVVCAIGASAGGLSPVEEFFDAMPGTTGVAFIVVQHLSPDHESMMVSLLSSHTDMPVAQAVHGEELEANHVYLISPGTQLAVVNDVFAVTERIIDSREIPRPIDVCFKSIAINYGRSSVAVVLSGTGSDGTLGIEAVRRAGGVTLTQDASAAFEGMPVAAQQSGFVDAVLDPTSLATAVDAFANNGRRPNTDPEPTLQPDEVNILTHIAAANEIDFREYKPGTIHRRLERRLIMSDHKDMSTYGKLLQEDPDERAALIDDLFIDVTSFFRDRDAFELIESEVMPALADRAAAEGRPIRIWTPGCATGEEAYSLTMLAMEAADRAGGPTPSVQTFATDVHGRALATAAEGVYSDDRLEAVSVGRRERFFTRHGDMWTVKNEVRSAVTFAKHNLLTDAPFTRVDLVSCRNLLIYFRGPAQERAISSMGFALRHNGVMFLGSSETIGFAAPDYSTISASWRIYRKESDQVEQNFRRNPPMKTDIAVTGVTSTGRSTPDPGVLRAYDAILSEQFAAGLLINDRREVTYVMGGATAWVQQPPGRPTNDVLSLISDTNLRLILGAALRELESGNDTSTPQALGQLYTNDDGHPLVLLGKRMKVGAGQNTYLLYVAPSISSVELPAVPTTYLGSAEDQSAFVALETELRHTRESLQSSLEEQETSNEELNAANEELIASNEELQSTNEELSSVNEELRTLNDEHQRRLDQVLELTADLEQLMSATEIAVIFLAEDCTVRRFNEPARDYFRIRDNDLGRPFEDVVTTLTYPELEADIEKALADGGKASRAVRNTLVDDQRLVAQVSRYELARNRFGVLIAIVNITDLELADEQRMLASALEALTMPFIVWSEAGTIEYANSEAAHWLGADNSLDVHGMNSRDWFNEEVHDRHMRDIAKVIHTNEQVSGMRTYETETRLATMFPFQFDGLPHVGYRNAPLGALLHSDELRHLRTEGARMRGLSNQLIIGPDGEVTDAEGDQLSQLPTRWTDGAAITSAGFDAERHMAALERSRAGETVKHRERLTVDGEEVWHLWRYVAVQDDPLWGTYPEGSVLLTTFDINEVATEAKVWRHRSAELEASIAELEQSTGLDVAMLAERNEDLDNFAHVAAHDLKAPVRSIRSFAEIALSEIPADSSAVAHIEKVIASSSRMGALIDSLLEFASIGRDTYEPQVLDLRQVVEDVTIDLRSSIEDSGAEVEIALDEFELSGNPDGLRQVIANLVQNSLKFSGPNAPRISVTSSAEDDGVLITVRDNGIGFPTEESGRLFEPFQRLHGTNSPGSGVGLAICRRIVQRHGGRIWGSSDPEGGSTFSFWLP